MDSISPHTLQRSSGNPYPGLRPFELEDRPWFFGRERQERELLVRLDRNHIVTVVGGSGCGKSSLIRAGLLPQLTNLGIPSAGRCWEPVVFVPGKTLDQTEARSPLHNLARAFLPTLEPQQEETATIDAVIDTFNQIDGFGRLVDAYSDQRRVRSGDERAEPNYLFVIDQFEELFSEQVRDSLEARSLVARIEDAWKRPHPRVFIVITIRSEHLNDCTAYPDFPEVINDTSYLVRRLRDSELKEAIVGPVFTLCEQVALAQDLDEINLPEFELDLIELLLREVEALAHDPDHLPLFQHCLFWLWRMACEEAATADQGLPKSINSCHLARAIGLGDQGELAKHAGNMLESCLDFHARSAYESLEEAYQPKAEHLFRVLATRDELQTYKRTPLALSRLNEIGLTLDDYQSIDKNMNLPHPYLCKTGAGEVDIYHEALIRKWAQFRVWINQEYERAGLYHDVCSRLARWQLATAQERNRWLLADEIAQAAKREDFANAIMPALLCARLYDWKSNPLKIQNPIELSKTQAEVSGFIRVSLEYHTEQRRQEEAKAATELAVRRRRRRQAFILLIIIAAVSWIATLIGFNLEKQATSRQLAARALLALKQDPARSAHLALAAVNQDPDSRAAQHALRQSLATLEIAHTVKILPHQDSVMDARFSPDGTFIIVASGDEVRMYDAVPGYEQKGAFPRKGVAEAWLNVDNSVLFTRTWDGHAQRQAIGSGTLQNLACDGPGDSVYTVTPSPDGRYIAAGCRLGRILVWDVNEPAEAAKEFEQKSKTSITTLAFDRGSRLIAAGDADGDVYVWKLADASQAWIGKGEIRHKNAVREVNFHPQSTELLVTAGDDKKAVIWQLDLQKRHVHRIDEDKSQRWQLSHNRPVISAKFAGGRVVTVVDKTARIWLSEQAGEKQTRGHDDWVREANTSPDGEYLVTASADGTARIWSTYTAGTIATLRGHRGEVVRASFSPIDRNLVITASTDGTVRIWRLNMPQTLWSADGWVLSARFDLDGKRLAAAGEGSKVAFLKVSEPGQSTVQDAEPEALEAELPPPNVVGANLSRISWSRERRYLAAVRTSQGIFRTDKLLLWDIETRRLLKPKMLEGMILGAFSQGTDRLVTVGRKTPVVVWDARSIDSPDGLKEITRIETNGNHACIGISPDGNWVAACEGRSVILWRCCKREAKPDALNGHLGEVVSIEFSPDSSSLVTTSRDQTARIWTVANPSSSKPLIGHTASVAYASFDLNGKQVASASADGTIRVWDVGTAEEVATLPWHDEGVNEVSFSRDGRILSASDDGSVRLGACKTCNSSLDELRSRIKHYAPLTENDRDWVKSETDVQMGWIRAPRFLSWGR